jgi:hypothetical protein
VVLGRGGFWGRSLGVVGLVWAGGFVISQVASFSSRLRVMWPSNNLSASMNLAFMVSATITDEASIDASIFASRHASTVASSNASLVQLLPGTPVCWVGPEVATSFASSALNFFWSALIS